MNKKIGMLLIQLIIITTAYAQQTGSVSGRITDKSNGEPLFFANVSIKGTSFGTVSDDEGRFIIDNLKPGNYDLIFSYLGYSKKEIKIVVEAGEIQRLDNIELSPTSVLGEEVIVTAQLRGQAASINQQVNSNTIVNVVSKDKIRELPDQNAAETVGRLSGISVIRDGGEGTKVTMRGMAPRLNLITINGQRISSTNEYDRSVDLSMFSTESLSGIEVYKALRPDMDADALGGTINFTARKASKGLGGDIRIQSGYNFLKKDPKQYLISATFEDRFFRDKLGIILSGTTQKANRGSEGYTGSWDDLGEKDSDGNRVFAVSNLTLKDNLEDRYRYSGSVTMDYKLDKGELMLTGNYGQTNRNSLQRRRSYRVNSNYQEYELRKKTSNNSVLTFGLSGEYDLFNYLETDFLFSYSSSNNRTPQSDRYNFREVGAYAANDESNYETIINSAYNDLNETFMKVSKLDNSDVRDNNSSFEINLKAPFNIGKNISGYLKFGGKYRTLNRDYDVNRLWTRDFIGRYIIENGEEDPNWAINRDNGWILIENFLGNYYNDDFMRYSDDAYYMGPGSGNVNGPGLDYGKLDQFKENYYDYYVVDPTIDIADYSAGEKITAAYGMYEINMFDKLLLLGGYRFVHTKNNYKSTYGTPRVNEEGQIVNLTGLVDTVGTKSQSQLLPQFQIKYELLSWADVRLAATKSLSRPNFFSLVPWERINNFAGEVERGNPDLDQMTAWNYDAILSFYGKYGLFTAGAFYKELEKIDYTITSRITDKTLPTNGYDLTMPINAEKTSIIKGLEFDLQTNLKFLPYPLNGILLNANYTLIRSETSFPYLIIKSEDVFPYRSTVIDTFRTGPMPGQVNDVLNLSVGYEQGNFSLRLSMQYQTSSLSVNDEISIGSLSKSVGKNENLDSYTGESTRWDLTAKQKIKNNFIVYLNVNNISNVPETSFISGSTERLYTKNLIYGSTVDLGLRYRF